MSLLDDILAGDEVKRRTRADFRFASRYKVNRKLFNRALDFTTEHEITTPEMLAEHLGVDSEKAANLHDALIDNGVVSKSGKVLIRKSPLELESIPVLNKSLERGASNIEGTNVGRFRPGSVPPPPSQGSRTAASYVDEAVAIGKKAPPPPGKAVAAAAEEVGSVLSKGKGLLKGALRGAGRVLPWALLAYEAYDALVAKPRERVRETFMGEQDLGGEADQEASVLGLEDEAKRRGAGAIEGRRQELGIQAAQSARAAQLASIVEKERGSLKAMSVMSRPSVAEIYAELGAM